jgi:hypothetical protein
LNGYICIFKEAYKNIDHFFVKMKQRETVIVSLINDAVSDFGNNHGQKTLAWLLHN